MPNPRRKSAQEARAAAASPEAATRPSGSAHPLIMRVYRTAPGVWGFGFGRSPGGWHMQFAVWVITTEPL